MRHRDTWTEPERELIEKYFENRWTEMTLFQRLLTFNSRRTYESMTRELRRYREKGWERPAANVARRMRIGYLDIETTNLVADFGIILSWYIKPRGGRKCDYAVITPAELRDWNFEDKRVVAELLQALKKYEIVYAHWGKDRRFDVPFIRSRACAHGLQDQLPIRGEIYVRDTWDIAKNKLKLHSNRLDSIAEALGVLDIKKTPLSARIWRRARAGDPESLKQVAKHNLHDVILLERVHRKMEPFERTTYVSM